MKNLNAPEKPPVPNAGRPIWELVIEDMRARDAAGRATYGTPLQAHNGRNALVDAYQEVLDLAVYLRQKIEEDGAKDQRIAELWAINTEQAVVIEELRVREHGTK